MPPMPSARSSASAPVGIDGHLGQRGVAHPHDGALAELPLDLRDGRAERLVLLHRGLLTERVRTPPRRAPGTRRPSRRLVRIIERPSADVEHLFPSAGAVKGRQPGRPREPQHRDVGPRREPPPGPARGPRRGRRAPAVPARRGPRPGPRARPPTSRAREARGRPRRPASATGAGGPARASRDGRRDLRAASGGTRPRKSRVTCRLASGTARPPMRSASAAPVAASAAAPAAGGRRPRRAGSRRAGRRGRPCGEASPGPSRAWRTVRHGGRAGA